MADEPGLRIGVLGSLLATRDGVTVRLPRGRVAVLLAVLAMSAGRPVSAAQLAELIWSDEMPVHVRASLHSLVARVRGLMPGVIGTATDGYTLNIDPDRVDLLQFRRLVRAADATSEPSGARQLLNQALGLWRGEPLSGLRSSSLDRDVVPGLTDERLSAVQKRADLDLAAGAHDRVIAELRSLTVQYPLREPLWAQFLRALVGAGRPAEAIQEYHRAREILAAELGVDPSRELQDLYKQLLHVNQHGAAIGQSSIPISEESLSAPVDLPGDPVTTSPESVRAEWARSVPRQLPAGTVGFAGRAAALRLLSELADEAVADPAGMVVSAISGMPGVGKTALALHWAHQGAARFADGQLYADLRGFDPSGNPASPSEVVRGFLDALGVPAARIPLSLDAQAALYRTMLAGRRVLIVLDNARDAVQVRPLLPGSPGCMVVVTSRIPLTSLAAGTGARLISLDVLTLDEAADLLARRLTSARIAADPQTASQLAALCGRLPLALAITAARAAARPHLSLAAFAGELRDARLRLDALDGGDPASNLRAVFSWSCQQLSARAAELFRVLSIHPGPDISLGVAASLAGTGLAEASADLHELSALNLLTEHRPGRYVFHDLLRAYAAEQASATLPPDHRRAAIRRLIDHYLYTGRNAQMQLHPQEYFPVLSPPQDKTVVEAFDQDQQAIDWFDAEYQALRAITALAASTGFDRHAWQISTTYTPFLDSRGHWHDWADVQSTALAAARGLGDKSAQACVLRASGGLCLRRGSHEQAHEYFSHALRLYCELGDPAGQARAHGSLSTTFAVQGRYCEALEHSERALELSCSAEDPFQHATMLNKVGWHAAHLGQYQRALAYCEQALDLFQNLDNVNSEARVWNSLGYVHGHLSNHIKSLDCYQHAIGMFRETGNRYELADTLSSLGDSCHSAERPIMAREAWQEAHTILNDLGHADAAQVHARLQLHDRPASPAVSTAARPEAHVAT